MAIEIKGSNCRCHPETCNCHPYYVFVDGQQTSLGSSCPQRLAATVKRIAESYYKEKL